MGNKREELKFKNMTHADSDISYNKLSNDILNVTAINKNFNNKTI